MVTKTETTEIVTKPKLDDVVQPSFKRWLRHLLHMPASKRFFNQQDQHAIAQAVAVAEHGHIGEIQVVIEGHIPLQVRDVHVCLPSQLAEQLPQLAHI